MWGGKDHRSLNNEKRSLVNGKAEISGEWLFGCPLPATLWLGAKWDNPCNFTHLAPDLHNWTLVNSRQSNEATRHTKLSRVHKLCPNSSCFTVYLYCKSEGWFHHSRRLQPPAEVSGTSIVQGWDVIPAAWESPYLPSAGVQATPVLAAMSWLVPMTLPGSGCILAASHCSWAPETLQKAR